MLTYVTTLCYGGHVWDIPFDIRNVEKTVMAINITGTLSLTAATWSKTSFAFTLEAKDDKRRAPVLTCYQTT